VGWDEKVLTPVDQEILFTLLHKVRTVTDFQIQRTWRQSTSRRQIERLESAGLVLKFSAMVHPELPLASPVVTWSPGDAEPNFAQASYRLRSRWAQVAVATTCVIASRRAARLLGGHGGRFPRESEETHDVHLAAVYLKYRAAAPDLADRWLSEEEIKRIRGRAKGKLPDAVLGIGGRVVEFGGAYRKAKLCSFHSYCKTRGFSYEVW
jgi:hypothetical protein